MAGMLSMASRNLPRPVLRVLNKYLEKSITEVPVTQNRAFHHAARTLRRVTSKAHNTVLIRNDCPIYGQGIRYFRASATLFDNFLDVPAPEFPDSVSEGDVRWERKKGDHVAIDEVVVEIETDKTAIPVPSPANGIIEEIYVENGQTVTAKTKLFKLKVTGEAPAKSAAPKAEPTPEPTPIPIPTPAAATPPPTPPKQPAAPPPPPAARPRAPTAQPVSSIPVAAIRHAAAIEAATVKMTGTMRSKMKIDNLQHFGKLPQDIKDYSNPMFTQQIRESTQLPVQVPPADPTKEISGTRTEQRVKMNRMRLKIAERLKMAQNINAMLTTFNEIDMTNIMEFRKSNLDAFVKKYGIKFGFMSCFLKASAYALQDQPVVNAVIDGTDIVYRDYVDISVAVATPKGLVVPVVRNVERMTFADIELTIAALGEKAKKGHLAVEDMDGGTFTVSNGGVFGSLMGTPIINPPQSAILGMHAIVERPVAINKQVVIRPMMYVALTYDHRLIDGREAVLFLRKIKAAVEDPRIIVAGL